MDNQETFKQKLIKTYRETLPCAIRFLVFYILAVIIIVAILFTMPGIDRGGESSPFLILLIPLFFFAMFFSPILGDMLVLDSGIIWVTAYVFTGIFMALVTQIVCMLVKLIQGIGEE